MRPEASSADAAQVRELCGQFEQVLLATLVPKSLFQGSLASEDGDHDDGFLASAPTPALFTQAFAVALERSGGLGLGAELARMLPEGRG